MAQALKAFTVLSKLPVKTLLLCTSVAMARTFDPGCAFSLSTTCKHIDGDRCHVPITAIMVS